LDNLTNASSEKFFEDEATKYEQESKRFWIAGVLILSAAAAAALLPLVLNYIESFIRQDSIDEGSRSIVGAITDKDPAEPKQETVP
jgi:hypothetical protein